MMDVGCISFGNSRAGAAIRVLKDEIIDRHMWEEEFHKKDYECEKLKEEVELLKEKVSSLELRGHGKTKEDSCRKGCRKSTRK